MYGMVNENERVYPLFLTRVLNVPFIRTRHALTSISSQTESSLDRLLCVGVKFSNNPRDCHEAENRDWLAMDWTER